MLQSDKEALHYSVIADTAHKIEKVSKELMNQYLKKLLLQIQFL